MSTSSKPLYAYETPMFQLTVSTVLILENGIIVCSYTGDGKEKYKFPGGIVKAGLESLQFAAVRYIKEQTGITLKKDLLIPVDYRSDPSRSENGNIIDIGYVCVLDGKLLNSFIGGMIDKPFGGYKWIETDFENRKIVDNYKKEFYMDHETLLKRAIDVVIMIKE